METTIMSSHTHFRSGLDHIMQAERQISRILPPIMQAVWSTQLASTLRQALTMSEQHQVKLSENYGIKPGWLNGTELGTLESRIMQTLKGDPTGSGKDLSIARLFAQIIQHKINCYEEVLYLDGDDAPEDTQKVIGAALSDEMATELFLQELMERFDANGRPQV